VAYSPTLTKLRFTLLAAGAIAESGNGTIGYTYAGDGQANGADQSIGSSQEGGIQCTVNSGPASYMGLSATNGSQDETSWQYGIQWYAGTSYYMIENGSTLGTPNGVGQAVVPAVGDQIRLRKIGVGATAEVIAELFPNGGSAWVTLFRFATKATVTLYPALRMYVGSESMGPMILQIGQAQARVPYSTYNVIIEGDSLQALQAGYMQDMAPFVGTGTVFTDLSVAGSQWTTLTSRVAGVNSAYNGAKTNVFIVGCGTNDSSVGALSNATIQANATSYLALITGTYAGGKWWETCIPRAGSYASQPARDTGNGTGSTGLVGLNTLFNANLASIGLTGSIDRRPTGGPYDFSAYLQANFDGCITWYAAPAWQEAWSGSIHPEQRGAQISAQYISTTLSAALVPDTVLSDGPVLGIQGPMFARRAPQTQGGFTSPFATHTSTGALVVGSATIAGTAAHRTLHTTTGALAVQSATMSGAAQHQHATTGALVVGSATIAGTAAHTSFGTHAASGALAVQSATMAGTAAHLTLHTSTGALVVGSATMAGQAAHQHASIGALVVGSATMAGTSVHTAAGTHSTIGSLAAGNALISATAQLTPNPNASVQYAYWLGQHRKRRWQLEEAARQERELLEQAQAEEQVIEQAIQEAPTKKSAMVARAKLNDNRLAQAKITILAKEIEKQIRAEADEADDVEVIQLFEAHRQAQIHAIMELLH
jgi:hypothetical protein